LLHPGVVRQQSGQLVQRRHHDGDGLFFFQQVIVFGHPLIQLAMKDIRCLRLLPGAISQRYQVNDQFPFLPHRDDQGRQQQNTRQGGQRKVDMTQRRFSRRAQRQRQQIGPWRHHGQLVSKPDALHACPPAFRQREHFVHGRSGRQNDLDFQLARLGVAADDCVIEIDLVALERGVPVHFKPQHLRQVFLDGKGQFEVFAQ